MKVTIFLCLALTLLTPALSYDVVRVTVSNGYGLRGDGRWGRTDGYVKVDAGSLARTTRVIWNDNSPSWRQTLYVVGRNGRLSIRVYDKDWFRDDYLGGCWIQIVYWRRVSAVCNLRYGRVYFSYYAYSLFRNLHTPAAGANSTLPVPTVHALQEN